MRVGWVFIAMGVALAAVGQHMDAYVFGVFLVVCGLAIFMLKGKSA